MDSYKRENPESGKAKQPPEPSKTGTANLHADSFKITGGSGRTPGGTTKRLGNNTADADKNISMLQVELEKGQTLVSKLEGRIAVLQRACAIVDRPLDERIILGTLGAGEASFTKNVAKMLQSDPGTLRRVQVALYQFEQARKGVHQSTEAVEKAMLYEGAHRIQYVEQNCHVEKLRGQLYPLINLHVMFKDNPLLAQLIPAPKVQIEELPPPPEPGAPPPEPSMKETLTGGLVRKLVTEDPALAEAVNNFKHVTGSLKERLMGVLAPKKKPDEP